MTKDIVPELLEKIQEAFNEKAKKDATIQDMIRTLKNHHATHQASNAFAIALGEILSEILQKEIRPDVLPDGKIYYNIAKRLLEATLGRNYDMTSDYARDVQNQLNKQANLSMKAIKPKINQSRVDGLVEKLCEFDDLDKTRWVLTEPIVNFTQSIVDDTIKENVEFQYKAGLKPKIVRKEAGGCCAWCKAVVGVYDYPDVPKDVYRRHRYCRCTVDYVPGDGSIQNVHTKAYFSGKTKEELEEFRKRQTDAIIDSREIKDKKDAEKMHRVLKNALLNKEINGIRIKEVSIHFAERAVLRNLEAEDVLDAIQSPLRITDVKYDASNRPSFNVIGEKSTVSINPENGNMITGHKTHSKLIKKLKGENNENQA